MSDALTRPPEEHARRLAVLEEHLGSTSEWPEWIRTRVAADHLGSNDRFAVTLFLLGNGLAPILIAEHMLPMLRDDSARQDVRGIFEKFRDRRLDSRVQYWDLDLKDGMPVNTLPRVQDAEFWAPAMAHWPRESGLRLRVSTSGFGLQGWACQIDSSIASRS